MPINDDMTRAVVVHASRLDRVPSPTAGVDPKMLFREGDGVARATSIVRYAPCRAFPSHVDTRGEETLVLVGTVPDDHGDYPVGSYHRNPPGTAHTPAAKDGRSIFVRLRQYRDGDRTQIVLHPGGGETAPLCDGASAARVLFGDGAGRVPVEAWDAGAAVTVGNDRGLEFLVLSGRVDIDGEALEARSWGRLCAGQALAATVGTEGATLSMKEAPPEHPDALQMPGGA